MNGNSSSSQAQHGPPSTVDGQLVPVPQWLASRCRHRKRTTTTFYQGQEIQRVGLPSVLPKEELHELVLDETITLIAEQAVPTSKVAEEAFRQSEQARRDGGRTEELTDMAFT